MTTHERHREQLRAEIAAAAAEFDLERDNARRAAIAGDAGTARAHDRAADAAGDRLGQAEDALTATTCQRPGCKYPREVLVTVKGQAQRLCESHAWVALGERDVYVVCRLDDPLNRDEAIDRLTDQGLWVQFMAEDRAMGYGEPDPSRHRALSDEITRRFGPDATENTAGHATAAHMSSDDIVTWAIDEYEHLIAVATGQVTA